MSLITTPVIPAQPNLPTYNFDLLAIIPSVKDRADYQAKAGQLANNWDDTTTPDPITGQKMPASLKGIIKLWAIRDGVTDPAKLMVEDLTSASGDGHLKPLTISDGNGGQRALTVVEMGAYNIPGVQTYPPYVIAPSAVTDPGTGAILNEIELSTELQAFRLAVSWGLPATAVREESAVGTFMYQYPAGEFRRRWVLDVPGVGAINVGRALFDMNQAGVGAPGHWAGQTWVVDASGQTDDGIHTGVGVKLPAPKRAMLATEEYDYVLSGAEIVNKLLIQSPSNSSGGASVGDYTAADRALQAHIAADLAAIKKALGV